jgi:predicted naringenin-chalcone synthase
MTAAHINRIGTAVPPHEVHDSFVKFVSGTIDDPKLRTLFDRMVSRASIEKRHSYLQPETLSDGTITDTERFYGLGDWPTTKARMERYHRTAPMLAVAAIGKLSDDIAGEGVTHLIVASCTGFVAPGLDQLIIAQTGISPDVERTVVGFMGCYAAVNALRLAHHIVRSMPDARVLVVTVELCSLHFQRTAELDKLLSMLLFGDGAAAALVTSEKSGIELIDFRAASIKGSADSITWKIGDQGFDMHLGGEVPLRIAEALSFELKRNDGSGILRGQTPEDFDLWAVHAGGRTILDAVERSFSLPREALGHSRAILRDFGNMSSATLMFVLSAMMSDHRTASDQSGMALAFGPGLAAETFRFRMLGL